MKNLLYSLSMIFVSVMSFSQNIEQTLNAEQVLAIVRQYHPIAKQATIQIKKSEADIIISKSGFEPIFNNYSAKKTVDGKNYYDYNSPELKIPTWFGIELSGGTERLSGNQYDPSETIGKTSYVGISVPLAKNLLFDKRRAALKQAKVFNSLAINDQKAILNDLLMDAMENYWAWVKAYQTYEVIKQNMIVSQKRLDLTKKSFINGERPAIDTVEALTQLQSNEYELNKYWLEFQNAGLSLSAFLWTENDTPFNLPETIIPQSGWQDEKMMSQYSFNLTELIEKAKASHPQLLMYDYKLNSLAIEKRLKKQELLPKIDLRYNQLGKGYDLYQTATSPLLMNNFQYGIKMEVPLALFQGRGEFKKVNLKIQETQLDQNQKRLQIEVKVKSYFNELENLKKQIELQTKNYANYEQLVNAEEIRFANGESSLFVINSRQNKALEALEKLIEIKTKYYKTVAALQWSAGLLN